MKIVIIGNGIAGTNAARFIRKRSEHQITMISEESWQPFSRTALMYVYMGHLKVEATHLYEDWFWQKNRIERVQARASRVDVAGKQVFLDNGSVLPYDKLIIATGSKPNKFGWPGQDLEGVGGLYHLQDLERMERRSAALQQGRAGAVIVGGGLIGIEMAEMFHSRHIPVTFLVREKSFWDNILPAEESAMVNRHIREHGIDLRLETELKEILGDEKSGAVAVVTSQGEQLSCGFVGLTAGVSPNIDFLRDSGIELNRGVLVSADLSASAQDVYAIGDCAELRSPEPGRRAIEAIWYTGRMMGQTLAATICGEPSDYKPKLWFNSAKFFDIEYQVYGDIPNRLPEGLSSLYWEHSDGKKSIRINYETASGAVTGFNLMGIRYRHEVCEKWILERANIETVLPQLALANFDPEFYTTYEKQVVAQYNQLNNKSLSLKSARRQNLVS
jgi:NAD(P)H-nitrite reductase large subunit